MLKAVVFDDEYIVLQGLQQLIDWSAYGIELAGTASDGLSALAMFQEIKPDLVLTDIRMPGLDGLQLVERIMAEAPLTYCIVFSGFNEFEYVRRAIGLGVADYLDKPVTIPSIEKAIQKVQERVNERQETLDIRRKWAGGRQQLVEKATLDLLLGVAEALPKWRALWGEGAELFTAVTVMASTGQLGLCSSGGHELINIVLGQEYLAVVLYEQPPDHSFWEELEDLAGLSGISVGVGRSYSGLEQAAASYKEAVRALRSARLLQAQSIVRFEELGEAMTAPKGLSEREEAMILCIRAANKAGMLEQVNLFLAWIQREKPDPEIVEREMLLFIYMALQAFRESGIAQEAAEDQDLYIPHIGIRTAAADGRLIPWFREQIESIADLSIESRENSKHEAVDSACAYIAQNMCRDVTLQEVADHVGLNASYLSVLFKEVVGESYIKYLTRYRVNLAKTLLAKGNKVNEVSESVGYHTYRHFSEVFKKSTGLTPGQYKESLGNPQ